MNDARAARGRDVGRIVEQYREDARMLGSVVIARGLAFDWNTNDGLTFLNAMGVFDEISVGRNWMTANAIELLWRNLRGDPIFPQQMHARIADIMV